jgi:uncharacterized membrane protein
MIWLQSGLLYLHVLGAIFWFGSGLTFQYLIVPALEKMPFESQKSLLTTAGANYGRIVGPVAGLTVLFGILRGISTGVLGALNTAYGITWILAIVGAAFVMFVGIRFIGPAAERMQAGESREQVLAAAAQTRRAGAVERTGMLGMLVLMVAMHAGY